MLDIFEAIEKKDILSIALLLPSQHTRIKKSSSGKQNILMLFCIDGLSECIPLLDKYKIGINKTYDNGLTALGYAIRNGNLSCIKLLLDRGASFYTAEDTPLNAIKLAIDSENLDCFKFLINLGLTVNFEHIKNCARYNLVNFLKFLVDTGMDLTSLRSEDNESLLHYLYFSRKIDSAEFLLSIGCDVNLVDNDGDTPLHLALSMDNWAVGELYLQHGAKLYMRNKKGESAASLARLHLSWYYLEELKLKYLSHIDKKQFEVSHQYDTRLLAF